MKEKIDNLLATGLVNMKQVARLAGIDQGNLSRRFNKGKMNKNDYEKIFKVFSDLIW